MTDQWTDRLSEYLDGTLARIEGDALERHLAECEACREVLADLGRVVERARGIEDRPPARDLWAGIARRIGATPGQRPGVSRAGGTPWIRRRISFTLPQLAAAAVALMLLAAATAAVVLRIAGPLAIAGTGTAGQAALAPRAVPVSTPRLDAAVERLEQALRDGQGRLDSTTVQIIERNLAIIDRAIAQAHQALERDPANMFLNRHLTNQKLRKLELLRRATELAAARST
jgi:anti-sigma factor RsiW